MKRVNLRNALIISAILLLAGAGTVWAHGGYGGYGPMMGYGGHGPMMGYGGYGGQMMGPGYGPMMGPGYGPACGNLSQDQYNKLDNARQKFYDQTQDLRDEMGQKNYAMQEELNKPNPDRAPARIPSERAVGIEGPVRPVRAGLQSGYAQDRAQCGPRSGLRWMSRRLRLVTSDQRLMDLEGHVEIQPDLF